MNQLTWKKEGIGMKIQEIAEKAGVSIATVSRVFSHHPNIRKEIRERVFSVARESGYHPRLSTKQRNVVIVAPYKLVYPVQAYVEMVMTELTRELSLRGYRIEILPHDNLERLESIQFCGAVSIGVETPLLERWDERFALPLILVDRPASGSSRGVFCVRSDEAQGMDLAISHLARCGCRRIGSFIHGRRNTGNVELRRNGVMAALNRRGLPAEEALIRVASAPKKQVLTDVVLETLSIIAYKQPVTKQEIEVIRGVKCDFAVNKLAEYKLVKELGRLDTIGKPIVFGTTEEFLRCFGVSSIEELPDIDEVTRQSFMEEAIEEVAASLNVTV